MEKIIVLILLSLAGVVLFCLLHVMAKDIWQDSKWYKKTKKYRIKELERKLEIILVCSNRTEGRMEAAVKNNDVRIDNVRRDLSSLAEFLDLEIEICDGWIYKNKKINED